MSYNCELCEKDYKDVLLSLPLSITMPPGRVLYYACSTLSLQLCVEEYRLNLIASSQFLFIDLFILKRTVPLSLVTVNEKA